MVYRNTPNPSSEDSPKRGRAPGPADFFFGGLVSWILVLAGTAALAAAGLIPAYFETLDLKEDRLAMAQKVEALDTVHQQHQDYYTALKEDDPGLIDRLAMDYLRLKPAGTDVEQTQHLDPAATVSSTSLDDFQQASASWHSAMSIDQELEQYNEDGSEPAPVARPRQTRLVSTVMGENRPWVAGVGALLLLLGLWPRNAIPRPRTATNRGAAYDPSAQ